MESKVERSMRRRMAAFITVVALASLLIVWKLVPRFTKTGMFLPPASEIITKLISNFTMPTGKYTMPVHIGVSPHRVGVAFIIAMLTGIVLSVSMGHSKTVGAIVKLIFESIRPILPLAWIPMSILRLGLGDQSKLFIIFLDYFCFITVNTYDGTENVGPMLLGAARILEVPKCQVLFWAVLSSSIPYVSVGLQITITVGWSAVIGTETVHSDEDVGWLIVMGMTNGNTVQTMVGMPAIGVVGYILAIAVTKLEGRLCIWDQQQGP